MRVVFLWRQPSGYFEAELATLRSRGHEIAVMFERAGPAAPFETDDQPGTRNDHHWTTPPSTETVLRFLRQNDAEVVVTASWGIPSYVSACAGYHEAALRVVGVDSPWRANPKQLVGRWTHRRRFHQAFDAAWVNGTPQWELVRRLGFGSDRVFDHFYCADTSRFAARRTASDRARAPFLFVGRLVEEKGVRELVTAHRRYLACSGGSGRALRIVGNGDAPSLHPGASLDSFLEPDDLVEVMDDSFALIHPARLEHWGVVVHEAACMGLPIVTTRTTGAASRFVSQGVSGWFVEPTADSIEASLHRLDRLGATRYREMSEASGLLGRSLHLDVWATHFEESVERLLRRVPARP